MSVKVLGISGKARFGKDHCAGIVRDLAEHELGYRTAIWPLASLLKARVFGEAAGELSFEDVWVNKPPVLRKLLQEVGTEKGRLVFGEDFWLLQAEAMIRLLAENAGVQLVIVPDIRFPNEVAFARFGGRAAGPVFNALHIEALNAVGYPSPDVEQVMLQNNPRELYRLDTEANTLFTEYVQHAQRNSGGACLRIVSDRPTLEGDAALHPSETALDTFPLDQYNAVIVNNLSTTSTDLIEQLRPRLRLLMGGIAVA